MDLIQRTAYHKPNTKTTSYTDMKKEAQQYISCFLKKISFLFIFTKHDIKHWQFFDSKPRIQEKLFNPNIKSSCWDTDTTSQHTYPVDHNTYSVLILFVHLRMDRVFDGNHSVFNIIPNSELFHRHCGIQLLFSNHNC